MSERTRPSFGAFLAWLAPFAGLAMLLAGLALAAAGITYTGSGFYQSERFFEAFDRIVLCLDASLIGESDYPPVPYTARDGETVYSSGYLDSCGDIVYFVRNLTPGSCICSNGTFSRFEDYDASVYAEKYRFVLSFDGTQLTVLLDGEAYESYRVRNLLFSAFSVYDLRPADTEIFLALGTRAGGTGFDGELLDEYNRWKELRIFGLVCTAGCVLGAVILLLSVLIPRIRALRRSFRECLMELLSHIPTEFKLMAALIVCLCTAQLLVHYPDLNLPRMLAYIFPVFCAAVCLLYFICDAFREGSGYFGHSLCAMLCRRIVRTLRAWRVRTPMERRYAGELLVFLVSEALLAVLMAVTAHEAYGGLRLLLCLCEAVPAVCILRRFLRIHRELLHDTELIRQDIERLRDGDYSGELVLPAADHDLYPLAEGLLHLRDGLSDAVEARVRSERMKAELVTNVSHDLKTPLTSIISYARLLDELGLEEPAAGYVKILCEKSDRLARLTRDLFEVSRAQSGSLPVAMERIDLKAHLEQTLAELSERIEASSLAFRIRLPEKPVFIDCDGERLYRVLENLVVNALSYAMSGTRVYVELTQNAVLSIRNVASYEMTFSPEEITERFVRGDASRTDGGTGLGLSIARSFTEAVGGRFAVDIDGDVFRVTLTFEPKDAPVSAPSGFTDGSEQ